MYHRIQGRFSKFHWERSHGAERATVKEGGFMSQEEMHVSLLKTAYKKWHETKAGSVEYWLGLMTDDIQFRSLASGAPKMEFTRTSTCKEEVKGYFSQLTSEWEMIHYTIDDYSPREIGLWRWEAAPSGINEPAKFSKHRKPTFTDFATARCVNSSSSTTLRR